MNIHLGTLLCPAMFKSFYATKLLGRTTMNKYTIEVFKETQDDWHPCYKLIHHTNLVLVRLSKLGPEADSNWRVSVWGADDDGMEWDYWIEDAARAIFMQVISMERVNKSKLIAMGFIPA